ncbi:MAG: hypothetical protein ABXS93_09805 [Sulfurimonas sp.]
MRFFLIIAALITDLLHAEMYLDSARQTYIDEIEAFPGDLVGTKVYIKCKKVTASKSNPKTDNYRIDAICQMMKDQSRYFGTNPFHVEFVAAKSVAKQIMYETDYKRPLLLYGSILKNDDTFRTSDYVFNIEIVLPGK